MNTDRTGLGCDGDEVFLCILPMLGFATVAIKVPVRVKVVEWTQTMTAAHHRHTTVFRSGIVKIYENRK